LDVPFRFGGDPTTQKDSMHAAVRAAGLALGCLASAQVGAPPRPCSCPHSCSAPRQRRANPRAASRPLHDCVLARLRRSAAASNALCGIEGVHICVHACKHVAASDRRRGDRWQAFTPGAFHRPALAASTRSFSAMPLAPRRAQVDVTCARAPFCSPPRACARVPRCPPLSGPHTHSRATLVFQPAVARRNAASTRMDLLAPAQIYDAVAEAGLLSTRSSPRACPPRDGRSVARGRDPAPPRTTPVSHSPRGAVPHPRSARDRREQGQDVDLQDLLPRHSRRMLHCLRFVPRHDRWRRLPGLGRCRQPRYARLLSSNLVAYL